MISKPTLTIYLPDGKTAGLYHAGEKASVDLLTAANEVKTYLKSRAMKRENKPTIKTVVSLVVLLLLMAVPSFGKDKNSPPTEDIDPLAKNYAQSVFEAIQKQHLHNQYLNRIGKASEVNFIIDMRNYIHNPQHPELNSQPFVSPSVKQALNGQINAYYQSYRHPFYIILSPIYARALDNSMGRKLFNPDILDFDDTQVWATFRERYRSYLQKLTEQKHSLFPAALEGRISDGAVLDIESQIFYKLIDDNYQISFDVSLLLSQTVDKSELVEDYYNQKIKANPAAFSMAHRHEPALQSYIQTVTEAFKTYYSPYREPQNLSEQIAQNRRTLSLPVYVMVRNNGYRLLREDTDQLFLDQWDQTFYDLHLGTGGGKPYFYIDRDGYVDATAMKYEAQQANPVIALSQLARTVRDVLVSTKIILDIVRVVGGDYLENNRPITELLEADAKQGTLSGTGLIQKASAARSKLYNEIQNGHYSGDELRARLLMLFDLTETLKKVFAQDSKYPFQRLTLAQIKVEAVTGSKVAPTDKDKALLDYLENRIANGETLSAQDQAEYLRLLCKLKGDCRANLLNLVKTGFGGIADRLAQDVAKVPNIGTLLGPGKENVVRAINALSAEKRIAFFNTLLSENSMIQPASNLLGKNVDKIDEQIVSAWQILERHGKVHKKMDFAFLNAHKTLSEEQLLIAAQKANDVPLAGLITAGQSTLQKNLTILETTEPRMAQALLKAFEGNDRSVFSEPVIAKLRVVFERNHIGNKTMASQVRETMVKEFNETMGKSLSFDAMMKITSKAEDYPSGLNLVSESGAKGSIFESWFEHNFQNHPQLGGNLRHKYSVSFTDRQDSHHCH